MSTSKIVLAQIGCGYWGPNLVRNFSALPDAHVKYVVDSSAERRAFVEANFPKTKAVEDARVVFADPEVTAVVIATPAGTHFEVACEALTAGKHIFVEKPLATRVAEVMTLTSDPAPAVPVRDVPIGASHAGGRRSGERGTSEEP